MVWFCYFCKKFFLLLWVWSTGTRFFHKLGQKMVILDVFISKFFQNYWIPIKVINVTESSKIFHWKQAKNIKVGMALGQNLGQIRSSGVKKVKKWALSIFFFIFYMGNTF